MTKRSRRYLLIAVTVMFGVVLGELGGAWSDVEYYAAFAGLVAAIVLVGLPWLEFAPDGAFHRRSPSR
jgi:hypothetical protein